MVKYKTINKTQSELISTNSTIISFSLYSTHSSNFENIFSLSPDFLKIWTHPSNSSKLLGDSYFTWSSQHLETNLHSSSNLERAWEASPL